jgi:hypothetical protein
LIRRVPHVQRDVRVVSGVAFAGLLACAARAQAKEDIEFVAEHLPEVAADNRYATLPVWNATTPPDRWSTAVQAAFARTRAGNLQIGGPMFSVAASRAIAPRWTGTVFAFADLLSFSGSQDLRPLQTLFAPDVPIARPVDASFDGLDGRMRHYGAGIAIGTRHWIAGVLLKQISLRDYRWNFTILAGDAAGTRGGIDFDADYRDVTPFLGLQTVRERGDWAFSPHALVALPVPRHGFVGHIETAQFDLHGDAADAGIGKHFGDVSVTLGFGVTYRPARLTLDIGTALSQRLLEPHIHKGVDSNWVLSLTLQLPSS